MTTKPDTQPNRNRLRAATLVALTTTVVAALLLGTTATANAATKRKAPKPLVAPTSVTLMDGVTCTPLADGTWDVTVRFEVTGGRYLNLGNPANGASTTERDNVYGGTRQVESTVHYLGFPGYADNHSLAVTDTFTYQHLMAPVTGKHRGVDLRSERVMTRDFEVTFACA